jgi:hypothetical protein
MRNVYKILVRKPEGKRTLRRPRHTWEEKIKMDRGGGGDLRVQLQFKKNC